MTDSAKEDAREENTKKFFAENKPSFHEVDRDTEGINQAYLASSIRLTEEINVDVLDPTIYSIQQAKLRTEEDHRMKLAEEKKEGVRKKIQQLRDTFKVLSMKNSEADEWIRLNHDDFNIDPIYFDMLKDRNFAKIEEAKKEVAWGIEFHTLKLNKLQQKFYDTLEFDKFTVKALKTGSYVSTFRVHKMSETLQRSIDTFKQMLESEMLNGKGDGLDFNEDDMEGAGGAGDQGKAEDKNASQNKTSASAMAKAKA